MNKYIPANKLIAEIERRRLSNRYINTEDYENELLEIINSLQEQPIRESHKGSWIEETKKELQHEEELLDMRLETLRSIRDKKNQFQREQPEEDIWKEIHKYFNPHGMALQFDGSKGNTILKPEQLIKFARHFAEWGATRLNARKEESK